MRRIQDSLGYLNEEQLRSLAKDQDVPLCRIQESASFFPHFRLTPPCRVTVKVCNSIPCQMAGAGDVLRHLCALPSPDIRVEQVSCLGRCDRAPVTCVTTAADSASRRHGEECGRDLYYMGRGPGEIEAVVNDLLGEKDPSLSADCDSDPSCQPADGRADWIIDPYRSDPSRRYEAARNLVAARDRQGSVTGQDGVPVWVSEVIKHFEDASLRGMGGSGFPAARKWMDVHKAVALAAKREPFYEAFVIVNGDESEPATFKDRELLLHFPHLIVESVIIGGLVTGATEGFIYIRHEYPEQIAAVRAEILRAEVAGLCGHGGKLLGRSFPISVFVSPGGYICGEQSALVEAMTGNRGEPRLGPPQLPTNGFLDKPTLLSNVETFAWVPWILMHGGAQYASLGMNSWKGRRFFSMCGDVSRPGVYEVPMGITLREMIYGDRYCGGIRGNKRLKAIALSGPSAGFVPATWKPEAAEPLWKELAGRRGLDPCGDSLEVLDMELELELFRALSPTKALGAGLIVFAEDRDMVEPAVNALEFFRNESCGKCAPCRIGSAKLANLGVNLREGRIHADRWRELSEESGVIDQLARALELTSICWLGRSVPMPLRTLIRHFPDDVAKKLRQPW